MCGIAGFFGARPVPPETVVAIFAAINRRGPDARHMAGWDEQWRVITGAIPRALLHTRLSIRDPRPEADQPMSNEAGDVWVCYNGEVYGWESDAKALAAEGFRFLTHSDTEFILNGYQAWGFDALLAKLRGMFALAILDLRNKQLWLARDRMGLKPVVYYHEGNEFSFASTVRAVMPYLPPHKRRFSVEGIDAYLAHRYIPAPRTVFQHIHRLENGHYLRFNLETGILTKTAYWQPTPNPGSLIAALDESVRLRTVADRPVGLFLSSGIDSSVVASRLAALGYTNMRTFTAAFADPASDESGVAASIASQLGMPNTRIDIPLSIRDDFAQIVADMDEPFADPSSFPTWYLAREASRHVKVVLSGDGGDELFGGYKRYRRHLRSCWRRNIRVPGVKPAPALMPSRLEKLRLELSMSWRDAYSLRFSGFTPEQRHALQPDAAPDWPNTYWQPIQADDLLPFGELLEIDRLNYLPEYILRKADLTTMAHGLEGRAPLLDQVFFQTVLALDPAVRFTKPAKLALLEGCPPCERLGLSGRKKMGFNPPLKYWLHEDLMERFDGIGARLQAHSAGQLSADAVRRFMAGYAGNESLAEKILQLLILDESLCQLRMLANRVGPHG